MNLDRIIAVRNDKTVFRDGDNCIKMFNANYSKSDILNEARNHVLLEESGVNVPEFIAMEKINGKWAIVTKFISGETLAQLMEKNLEKREKHVASFVDLQLSIHEKKARLLNHLENQLSRRIEDADLPATTRYHLLSCMEAMPGSKQICHGDFTPSNIIVTEDDIPFVVDWSHATIGNAKADCALTYLLLWMRGKIDHAAMYLEQLCKKSGFNKKEILDWMPIIAASQYTICSEKEREFLLSWINAIYHK